MTLELDKREAGGRKHVVRVRDSEHPGLLVEAHFLLDGAAVALVGLSVLPDTERLEHEGQASVLTISKIRQLPLASWEQAARAEVATTQQGRRTSDLGRLADITHLIDQVRPGLVDDDSPAATRELERAWALAKVALEYRDRVRAGSRSPVADIAEAWGERSTTIRGRIHRARQAGFLGPASGTTAGEGIRR